MAIAANRAVQSRHQECGKFCSALLACMCLAYCGPMMPVRDCFLLHHPLADPNPVGSTCPEIIWAWVHVTVCITSLEYDGRQLVGGKVLVNCKKSASEPCFELAKGQYYYMEIHECGSLTRSCQIW